MQVHLHHTGHPDRPSPAGGGIVPAPPPPIPTPAAPPAGGHVPAAAGRWLLLYRLNRRLPWMVVASAPTRLGAVELIGVGNRRHGEWRFEERAGAEGGEPCRS